MNACNGQISHDPHPSDFKVLLKIPLMLTWHLLSLLQMPWSGQPSSVPHFLEIRWEGKRVVIMKFSRKKLLCPASYKLACQLLIRLSTTTAKNFHHPPTPKIFMAVADSPCASQHEEWCDLQRGKLYGNLEENGKLGRGGSGVWILEKKKRKKNHLFCKHNQHLSIII